MIRKIFRYMFWAVTLSIMIGIFCLSSQTAQESLLTSEGFTKDVLSMFEKFRELPAQRQNEIVQGIQGFVRKSAHFSVYTALGVSTVMAFYLTFKGKFLSLYALVSCFIYALSDELHQCYVPGRSGEVRDVLIDTSGALLGILFVMLIRFLILKRKAKR